MPRLPRGGGSKSSERVPFMLRKGVAKRQNGWGRAAFRSLGQRYRARPG